MEDGEQADDGQQPPLLTGAGIWRGAMSTTLDRSRPYGTFRPPWARLDGVAVYEQDGKMFGPNDQELSPEIAATIAALEAQGTLPPPHLSAAKACQLIIAEMVRQGFHDLPPNSAMLALVHEAWVRRTSSS